MKGKTSPTTTHIAAQVGLHLFSSFAYLWGRLVYEPLHAILIWTAAAGSSSAGGGGRRPRVTNLYEQELAREPDDLFVNVPPGSEGSSVHQSSEESFLYGYWRPVAFENYVEELEVVSGRIPEDFPLGTYLRNGPNPRFLSPMGNHIFDGDGMVHAVSFSSPKGGKRMIASYVNRQMKTPRLVAETAANRPRYTRIGDIQGKSGLLKMFLNFCAESLGYFARLGGDLRNHSANTAIVQHNAKVYALCEVPASLRGK